jgi:hypothetical protein
MSEDKDFPRNEEEIQQVFLKIRPQKRRKEEYLSLYLPFQNERYIFASEWNIP